MGASENKELVRKTWEAFVGGDVKTAFANLADGVTWTIPGSIPDLSGTKRGKDEIFRFLGAVAKLFPGGMKTEVKGMFADGDTVIAEMTNRSTTASGRSYENDYCFVFEIGGGKIQCVREYVDTQKAAAILGS